MSNSDFLNFSLSANAMTHTRTSYTNYEEMTYDILVSEFRQIRQWKLKEIVFIAADRPFKLRFIGQRGFETKTGFFFFGKVDETRLSYLFLESGVDTRLYSRPIITVRDS